MYTSKELNRMSPTAVRRYALQLQERVAELEAAVPAAKPVAKPVIGALPLRIVDGIIQIGDRRFVGEVGTYANGAHFVKIGDRVTVKDGHAVSARAVEKAVEAGFLREPLP